MTAIADLTREQVQAERLSRRLRAFVDGAWPILEPSTPFKPNWHIDAICDHLEAVTAGEIRRLVINVPPRHMKSLSVAVCWPCWTWTRRPELRWVFASYAQKLSTRDSLKCRRLIESPWYQSRWGHVFQLTGDQNEKTRFENDRTGFRVATSVGGTATGEGGDIVVADDPHKADEAESDTMRESVLDWWDGTISTRLNDPDTGAFVVVMQRVHEADLVGHLLDRGGYEVLCLPAEYEPAHPFAWPSDPRSEPGELLWPARMNRPAVDELKATLGSYRAAGQLQQRPAPVEGGILKRAWWQWYGGRADGSDRGDLPLLDGVVQSWDTAWKDKQTSDLVVGQVWGWRGAHRYLLNAVVGHLSEPEVKREVRSLAGWVAETFQRFDLHPILIPKTDVGPEIIADLRRSLPGVIGVTARGDKVQRAHAVSPQLEAGQVWLPGWDERNAPAYAQSLVNQAAGFPNVAHDDEVDAMTQALIWLAEHGVSAPVAEPDPQLRQHSAGLRDRAF
ncbi:MAG: phage terminase large subunit [Thermoanaerobaculia bacterium]|nr:phage terminase large subunit [Thermoanaerobaculia bacterium]